MKGFRKDNPESLTPEDGQYGKDVNGQWFGCAPGGFHCNLGAHTVKEHPDGTITDKSRPSILVTSHLGQWHGHLIEGEWKQC